jgi:putative ABC transport system permease protein
MRFSDLLSQSSLTLRKSRGRTALSMLGIVVGITSVILVLSIGEAAQGYLLNQIASFGSDVIFVESGEPLDTGGVPTPFPKQVLTESDYKAVKRQAWVKEAVALVVQQDELSADGVTLRSQVWATGEAEPDLYDMGMDAGTWFSAEDVDARARVGVLGYTAARDLFGMDDAVGRSVTVNATRYRIVGVAEKTGSRFLQDVDKMLYIPFTAAMDAYGLDRVMNITFTPADGVSVPDAVERVKTLIRSRHNQEDDPLKDDFRVITQEDAIKTTQQITQVLQLFLTSVAAISLLVGGIGIMNIMYVSVTERTREIGLRKSIGAKRGEILSQFLTEALFLTVLSGIIGIILGTSLTWLAIQIISSFQTGWAFQLSWQGIVWGVGVSTAIGLVFGYFPARSAAKLSPIEALRYE